MELTSLTSTSYRGRLAPSPTGLLHLGHARTFWIAYQRALAAKGALILRNEDLDAARCRPDYFAAIVTDLHWLGIDWQEGPDCGGPLGPYAQSLRLHLYKEAFEALRAAGMVYPCTCSRQDVLRALQAAAPRRRRAHLSWDLPFGSAVRPSARFKNQSQLALPRSRWRSG